MAKAKAEVKLLTEFEKSVLGRKAERQADVAEAAFRAMREALAGADEGRYKQAAGYARRAVDAVAGTAALLQQAASGKHATGGGGWDDED